MPAQYPSGTVKLESGHVKSVGMDSHGEAPRIIVQPVEYHTAEIINLLANFRPEVTLANWDEKGALHYDINPAFQPSEALHTVISALRAKGLITAEDKKELSVRLTLKSKAQEKPAKPLEKFTPVRTGVHAVTMDYQSGGIRQTLYAVGTDDIAIAIYPDNIAFQVSKKLEGAQSITTAIMARLYQLKKEKLSEPGNFDRSDKNSDYYQAQISLGDDALKKGVDAILKVAKRKPIIKNDKERMLLTDAEAALIRSEILQQPRAIRFGNNEYIDNIAVLGHPQSWELVLTAPRESAPMVLNVLTPLKQVEFTHLDEGSSHMADGNKLTYKVAADALPCEALAAITTALGNAGLISAEDRKRLAALRTSAAQISR